MRKTARTTGSANELRINGAYTGWPLRDLTLRPADGTVRLMINRLSSSASSWQVDFPFAEGPTLKLPPSNAGRAQKILLVNL